MRIAQIAPLFERVPPKLYGGTERIVSYLTEELVADGHDVTLFASADSITGAELVAPCNVALWRDPAVKETLPYRILQLEQVRERAHQFDVLHFHIDMLHFPMVRDYAGKTITTLHGRLDLPDLKSIYQAFPEIPLCSISDSQRAPMPPVNWAGTVLHGLPLDLLPFTSSSKGDYLAFLGRISPEKGPDKAIEIANKARIPLLMAAKIDQADQAYWEQVIQPMVAANPLVTFVGEINEAQKASFLGNARALLFPISWPEPFGLVMIEAMACGCPVVAFDHGSVPEVLEDDVSGFIVNSVEQAVSALQRLETLPRTLVRAAFERRFSASRMAADYLDLYRELPGVQAEAAVRTRAAGPTLQIVG